MWRIWHPGVRFEIVKILTGTSLIRNKCTHVLHSVGVFSDNLKIAKVFKSGDEKISTNYQFLSREMEKFRLTTDRY